jgi:predicted transcriptional regulator
MMVEQKGRGGKKPKYQIADIGGSDLTPQDLSTERVLNFLIKGEAPADQGAGTPADGLEQAGPSPEQTAAGGADEPAHASLPSSGPPGKKSLDHLFRRASAGGAAAKDLKLELRAQEESVAPPAVQAEAEADLASRPAEAVAAEEEPTPAAPQAPPPGEPEARPQATEPQRLTPEVSTATPAESAELTQLISLWKSFYRLKDGEIEALSAMYRMSHGLGTDECYVKMHKLAEMSNLTYRYCQKVVRSLEQLGWITKLKDYDPSTQLGVLYRINLKPSV